MSVKNLQQSQEILLISIEVTGLFNIICYSLSHCTRTASTNPHDIVIGAAAKILLECIYSDEKPVTMNAQTDTKWTSAKTNTIQHMYGLLNYSSIP